MTLSHTSCIVRRDGVIARAQLRAGDSLVDTGCGTGRDAEHALMRLLALAQENGAAPGRVTLLDTDEAIGVTPCS